MVSRLAEKNKTESHQCLADDSLAPEQGLTATRKTRVTGSLGTLHVGKQLLLVPHENCTESPAVGASLVKEISRRREHKFKMTQHMQTMAPLMCRFHMRRRTVPVLIRNPCASARLPRQPGSSEELPRDPTLREILFASLAPCPNRRHLLLCLFASFKDHSALAFLQIPQTWPLGAAPCH